MAKQRGRVWIFFNLLRKAFGELKANDPLRLAAATAFFTTFALPPILIIMVQVFGMLFRIENISDQFFERIASIIGSESSTTIKRTFLGFKSKAENWWITIGGFVFLMFVATTLFRVIKDSLNQLWHIKQDNKVAIKVKLQNRAMGMTVILLAGILFIAGTMAEGVQVLLGDYINEFSPNTATVMNNVINKTISVLIVTTWFTVLFKLLPDANPTWKVVLVGGFFTGILFTIGKILIPKFLPFGELASIFGTSASIVLLLLFVFYSSFILYYGACFTKVYADHISHPIQAGSHAYKYDAQKTEKVKEEAVVKEESAV